MEYLFGMIGQNLDRYKIVDELGHGGMSTVYRGVDEALEREVAIKVMHDHLAKSLENRKRFHREAKAIARLKHPNILEIYDYSSFDAVKSFIVMELVPGFNLRQFIFKHGNMPSEITAAVGLEICQALSHAHQSGVIHRDLKPENVMVSDNGHIKLMDFGIAHVVGAETMTQTGSLLGSPAHIPPELIDGQPVDIRSDIYSLGTILYYLATAQLPYDGVNAPQVFKKVLTGEFDDPEFVLPQVGGCFGRIVRTCMEKSPDKRYQTVDALIDALENFISTFDLQKDEELHRYFHSPGVYKETFPKRIVPLLLTACKKLKKENKLPILVSYFNRILAYEPNNSEVKNMMASLGRRKITENAIVGILGLCFIFMSLYFWKEHASTKNINPPNNKNETPDLIAQAPDENQAIKIKKETTPRITIANNSTKENPLIPVIPEADHKLKLKEKQKQIKANVTKTDTKTNLNNANLTPPLTTKPKTETTYFSYRFSIIPGGASFVVDGINYDVLKARRGIQLSQGTHRIRVSSPGAETLTRRLTIAGEQKGIFPIVLKWKSGRVQVVSNTDSVVWIGKGKKFRRIQARGKNATFTIPFGKADKDASKKRITIRVASAEDMGHPKIQTLWVKPGQLTTINVNFQPKK